jgi:hypothetical protein
VFGAGDRMRRHELADARSEGGPRRGHHVGFGAASVGDHARRPQVSGDLRKNRRHLADRRGDQHEVGIAQLVRRVDAGAIDEAQIERFLKTGRPPAETDHLADGLRRLERQGKGAADQPDAENDDLGKFGRRRRVHAARACSSAARKRSFSGGVPMVTRSHSGMA